MPQLGKPHSAETRVKAYELFRKRQTIESIAAVLGVPFGTVQRWSCRDHWKSRREADLLREVISPTLPITVKPRQSKTEASNSEPPPETNETGKHTPDSREKVEPDLTFEEQQRRYKRSMAVQASRLPEIMAGMTDAQLIANATDIKALGVEARKALGLEESKPVAIINVGLLARPAQPKVIAGESVHELPTTEVITIDSGAGQQPARPLIESPEQ